YSRLVEETQFSKPRTSCARGLAGVGKTQAVRRHRMEELFPLVAGSHRPAQDCCAPIHAVFPPRFSETQKVRQDYSAGAGRKTVALHCVLCKKTNTFRNPSRRHGVAFAANHRGNSCLRVPDWTAQSGRLSPV